MSNPPETSGQLSRRRFLEVTAAGAGGIALAGVGLPGAVGAEPGPDSARVVTGLSAAGRVDNPIGVDERAPQLAWRQNAGYQRSYQIRAARTEERLPTPDLWDTGWVESDESSGVVYGGSPLESRERVVWQVRVRDAEGEASAWSEPSSWEVGLLDPTDWSPASWVEHPDRSDHDPLPIFARAVNVATDRLVRARLRIAGFGVYVARVNGALVTDDVLCPGPSNAQRSVEAGTYDVTSLLVDGANTLTIELGNGIFNVGDTENPAVGRTSVYRKFESTRADPTSLLEATTAGAESVLIANGEGLEVGVTLNVDTGDGGRRLESRRVVRVVAGSGEQVEVFLDRSLTIDHDEGAVVTRSGNADATDTAITPRFIARLELTHDDGRTDAVVSDADWRTALGPVVTDSWYAGTDYDARREQPGWTEPGADHTTAATRRDGERTGWQPVGVAPAPNLSTALRWRRGEPVRVVDSTAPVEITEPTPGTWVFDFGQNASAVFELRLRAGLAAGTTVRMQPSESLRADGTVDAGSMGDDENIYDTYTTHGAGAQSWRLHFVYHGFQYVQVTGLPTGYTPDGTTLTALPVRAVGAVSGDVMTSSDLVNRLRRMSRYSIASNMQAIFTDCPNREKLGWLADLIHSIHSIDRTFEMSAYLRHMQLVMEEAQLAAGTDAGLVPGHAPEFPVFDGGYRIDLNWGSTVILTPWWLWQHHGDTQTMDRHWDTMVRYHDYVRTQQAGEEGSPHLVASDLLDWVADDETTPAVLTGTFGYYVMTDRMAQMAEATGRAAQSRSFRDLADLIRDAFNQRYFNSTIGAYTLDGMAGSVGTQAADALALEAGLVPEGSEQRVLDSLVERIYAYHPEGSGPHISGGTISLGPIFRALNRWHRDDVIWEVLHQTTRPSYGAFLLPTELNPAGMTTIPEHWYAPDRNSSLNHVILLQVDEWFSTGLAGIHHVPGSIAYRNVRIEPRLVGVPEHPLTRAEGFYETPRGRVSSAWRLLDDDDADLELAVTIPANTTAEIHVPTARPGLVWLDGRPARASRRLDYRTFRDGYAVYAAGPGTYRFTSRLPRG